MSEEVIKKIASDMYDTGFRDSKLMLSTPLFLISHIESCNFTCDELHRIILAIEDMKGSDYESDRSEDLTDSLREQRGEFDRL